MCYIPIKLYPNADGCWRIDSSTPIVQAQRLGKGFKQMLNRYGKNEVNVKEMVEKLMKDGVKADKSKLPGICALDMEFNLSSIFVEMETPLVKFQVVNHQNNAEANKNCGCFNLHISIYFLECRGFMAQGALQQ